MNTTGPIMGKYAASMNGNSQVLSLLEGSYFEKIYFCSYTGRALAEDEESDEEDDDSDFDGEVLESDEDEIDDEGADYLERLEKVVRFFLIFKKKKKIKNN